MRYIVAFQECGKNAKTTESIGVECAEEDDGWAERCGGLLEVEVELGEELAWNVHGVGSCSVDRRRDSVMDSCSNRAEVLNCRETGCEDCKCRRSCRVFFGVVKCQHAGHVLSLLRVVYRV